MALFPSFATTSKDHREQDDSTKYETAWLRNTSFKPSFDVDVEVTVPGDVPVLSSTAGSEVRVDLPEIRTPESSASSAPSLPPSPHRTESGDLPTQSIRRHHKSHKSKHTKHKKKKSHKDSSSSRSRAAEKSAASIPLIPPPRKVFIEEIRGLGYEDAYRLDRQADRDNYRFSSLNKKHLSSYKAWTKLPLGIKRDQLHQWLTKSTRYELTRYYGKKSVAELYRPGESMLTDTLAKIKSTPSHIDLPKHDLHQIERSEVNPLGIYDRSTELWAEGKPLPVADSSEMCDTPANSYLLSAVAQQIATYNRDLRESPDNIKLWLELIDLQDGLLQQRTEDDSNTLFTEQVIHEKKLSIVSQALKKNPSNLQLMLKQLKLHERTMEWSELNEQWKSLTFAHVNNIDVWRGYLTHVKSNFSKFTVGMMLKAYSRCLKSLRRVRDNVLKSHQPNPDTENHLIGILLELCDLLHLANSTERAVAILQSILEINLFNPDTEASHESMLQGYQHFFDSGQPLIGEPGACGWNNTIKPESSPLTPVRIDRAEEEAAEEELVEQFTGANSGQVWLELEHYRQLSHWLPWKPSGNGSEDDCDDPSRLVVSDDFVDVLFYIRDGELRQKMCVSVISWFVRGSDGNKLLTGVNSLGKSVDMSSHCETKPWSSYKSFTAFTRNCMDMIGPALYPHYRCQLAELRLIHESVKVKLCNDKKDWKRQIKEFKSFAKALLSAEVYRTDRQLWLSFAACYKDLGLYSEMTAIYNGIISTELCLTRGEPTEDRLALYWQALSSELETSDPDKERLYCLICYLVIGCNVTEKTTPLQQLQALREVERLLDITWGQELGDKQFPRLSYLLPTYILLNTLVHGLRDVDSSLSHWMALLQDSSPPSSALRCLYLRSAQVLSYIQTHLYQSCHPILRQLLQQGIRLNPGCKELLDMYLKLENSVYALTRVRQLFTSSLAALAHPNGDDACGELVAVYYILFELSRMGKLNSVDTNTGLNNRIRSVCHRCTSRVAPHSVLIWRLTMYHEAIHGRQSNILPVFYAAIQACPYAKCLYTDAISYLPEKLQEIVDIAEEKEVRVHLPVDELKILTHRGPEAGLQTLQDEASSMAVSS